MSLEAIPSVESLNWIERLFNDGCGASFIKGVVIGGVAVWLFVQRFFFSEFRQRMANMEKRAEAEREECAKRINELEERIEKLHTEMSSLYKETVDYHRKSEG